jgi:hypothetical protein
MHVSPGFGDRVSRRGARLTLCRVAAALDPRPSAREITYLLRGWADGAAAALDQLPPAVYERLRRLAADSLRRNARATPCSQPRSSTKRSCG